MGVSGALKVDSSWFDTDSCTDALHGSYLRRYKNAAAPGFARKNKVTETTWKNRLDGKRWYLKLDGILLSPSHYIHYYKPSGEWWLVDTSGDLPTPSNPPTKSRRARAGRRISSAA